MLFTYLLIRFVLFPVFLVNVGACVKGTECSWDLLEGYVGLITLAILVGGVAFTVFGYFEQESRLTIQVFEAIHEKITDPTEEAARRWIIKNIDVFGYEENLTLEQWIEKTSATIYKRPRGWKEKLSPGHKNIKMTLNTLDYIGFVEQHYANLEGPTLE